MENVNLILKPYHLPALIDAVKARRRVLENDTSATADEKAIIADLERRADLLHVAITSEAAAKDAREAYNRHVQRARYCNRHPDKAAVEPVTEPVEAVTELTSNSTATLTKRPA